MYDTQIILELQNDCQILLDRALTGQTLAMFGEDGFGQHGTSYSAKHHKVSNVDLLLIAQNLDTDEDDLIVRIMLDGYDHKTDGHAVTDQNLRISLNSHFVQHSIPSNWKWGTVAQQPENGICIYFKVHDLLQW